MTRRTVPRMPLPSSWHRPDTAMARADQGARRGYPGVAQYLRHATRAVGAAVMRIWPAGVAERAPVLAPGPWDAPGSLTPGPAGWFTLAVQAGPGGFQVGRQVFGATELAHAIWHCLRWRGRPVLLVIQPTALADGAGSVLRQLCTDLGTPVYAADRGVRFTFGRAFADRVFWCWKPGSETGEPESVGAVLPPLATPHRARSSRAATGPAPVPVPPVPVLVPVPPEGLPQLAAPGRAATAPGTRDGRLAEPTWFPVRARIEEADRERLRAVLGWKFQAHTRAVSRAMALHPGLRGAVGSHDAGAGLVAVLALLDGVSARVNAALRGGGTPDEEIQLLARCASAGLAQLPAVTGPVLGTAPAGLDLARLYHPGEVLVEPAFTELSLSRGTGGDGPGYAIWPATARRLDQLRTPDELAGNSGQVMFAAGTRFAVLGVLGVEAEGPAEGPAGGPGTGGPCVLLRELAFDRRDSGLNERAAGKLRAALGAYPDQTAAPASLPWPLGLDAGNRRFPVGCGTATPGSPAPPHIPDGDGHDALKE